MKSHGTTMVKMNETDAVSGLSALGNQTRLAIFKLLVRAGKDGLTIGRIGSELGIPLSTLAHHLDRLVRASLVQQTKAGREIFCVADFTVLQDLMAYLNDKCCEGLPGDIPAPETGHVSSKELIDG